MAPEAAIWGVKMVEQEIDVVAEKIRQLDTQMRQNRQAGEEAEALKQFDADCKAQESGLQATVARLKTEESLLTTSVKTREAQIQAWYDEQRLMADKL
jgi:DNA-binding ferritin-like protein